MLKNAGDETHWRLNQPKRKQEKTVNANRDSIAGLLCGLSPLHVDFGFLDEALEHRGDLGGDSDSSEEDTKNQKNDRSNKDLDDLREIGR